MTPARRTRLFTGIYADRSGVAIVVSVNGTPREFRKDASGIPYSQYARHTLPLERKRIQEREDLKQSRLKQRADTFAQDVDRFLATLSSPGHRVNTRGYLAHWTRHFADRARNEITDLEAQTAFAQIHAANWTKIHIRRALIQFYDVLNGKSGYNPGRSLTRPPKGAEPVRDLPWADIEKIFAALPESKSKVRLMLIAYVGLPQKQIALLRPSDLRLAQKQLVVHPRRKGAGAAGRVVPLSKAAVAALRRFHALNAYGPFQNRQMVETFRSGARKARVTLPPGARPYDLRHSFLTEVARGGADIQDIAHLGMHATLQQAARYIQGAASARATKMIRAVPRFQDVATVQTTPKHSTRVHRATMRRTGTPRGKKARNL